jgi:hypothetical protein
VLDQTFFSCSIKAMPCPLRVVLVAISACLLLFAASSSSAELAPVEQQPAGARKGVWTRAREKGREVLRIAWLLASGKVILQRLRGGGEE